MVAKGLARLLMRLALTPWPRGGEGRDCKHLALTLAHPALASTPRPLGDDCSSPSLVLKHPALAPLGHWGLGDVGDGTSLALVLAHPALAFPRLLGGVGKGSSLALMCARPALAPPSPPPATGGGGGDGKSLALVLAPPALAPPSTHTHTHTHTGHWGWAEGGCHKPSTHWCLHTLPHPLPSHRSLGVGAGMTTP